MNIIAKKIGKFIFSISKIVHGAFSRIEIKKYDDEVTLTESSMTSSISMKPGVKDEKDNKQSSDSSFKNAKDGPQMQKSRGTYIDKGIFALSQS